MDCQSKAAATACSRRHPGRAQAQQRGQLRGQDQQRRSLREAGEHGRGHQVEQPAGAHQPQRPLHQARQNRHPCGQRHPVRGAGLGQARERGADQQRAQGRGSHAQTGRAAEQHGHQGRNDGCVNARDQRHARKGGIGHALGQKHQTNGETCPELPAQHGCRRFGPCQEGKPARQGMHGRYCHANWMVPGCSGLSYRRLRRRRMGLSQGPQ